MSTTHFEFATTCSNTPRKQRKAQGKKGMQQKELCNKSTSQLKAAQVGWPLATRYLQLATRLPATCHVLQVPLTRRACSASYADPSWGESWTCATWPQRAASAKCPAALPQLLQQQQHQLFPFPFLLLSRLQLQLQLLLLWQHAAYSGTSWRCHSVRSWQTSDATCCPHHGDHCCHHHHDDHDVRAGSDAGGAPSAYRSRLRNCKRMREGKSRN